MLRTGLFWLAVIGLNIWGVTSLTKEESKTAMQALLPALLECVDECSLTEDSSEDDNEEDDNEEDIDLCIKMCILKRLGLLNKEGNYNSEWFKEQLLHNTDKEEEATKFQEAMDDCFGGKEVKLPEDDNGKRKRIDDVLECMKKLKF